MSICIRWLAAAWLEICTTITMVFAFSGTSGAGDESNDVSAARAAFRSSNLQPGVPATLDAAVFRFMDLDRKLLSEAEAIAFVEAAATLWESGQDVREIVEYSWSLSLPRPEMPHLWMTGRLAQQGISRRCQLSADIIPGSSEQFSDAVQDGLDQVYYIKESNQASYYQGGAGWIIYSPFQLCPRISPDAAISSIARMNEGVIQIDAEGLLIDVDVAAGVIRRTVRRTDNTKVIKRYASYTSRVSPTAGRIEFPSFSAWVEVIDGKVNLVHVFLVKNVEFPANLDRSEFAVPIPGNTIAALYPPGEMRGALVSQPVSASLGDAREHLPALLQMAETRAQREAAHAARKRQLVAPSHSWTWLVIVNGAAFVLIVCGLILMRRR